MTDIIREELIASQAYDKLISFIPTKKSDQNPNIFVLDEEMLNKKINYFIAKDDSYGDDHYTHTRKLGKLISDANESLEMRNLQHRKQQDQLSHEDKNTLRGINIIKNRLASLKPPES